MAQVILKDKWWTDPRRSALLEDLKSELIVDGLAVKLFRVAQDYWKNDKNGIPLEIFKLFPHTESLVRVGLVSVEGSFVFVRGSLEHLDWLRVANENASKAGKRSAEARQRKSGTAQPKLKITRSKIEPPTNHPATTIEQESTNIERSYSPSPSSSYSSLDPPSGESPPQKMNEGQMAQKLLGHYCELWKAKYNADAAVSGKWAGNAKTLVRDHGLKKAMALVSTFMAMNETWFIKNRHRFDMILTDLAKVNHFAGTGIQITDTQLRQVDQSMANKSAGEGAAAFFLRGDGR